MRQLSKFAAGLLLTPALAIAQEGGGFLDELLGDMDLRVNGFVRAESAYSTTQAKNRNNQEGNPFNQIEANRTAYLPPALALGAGKWGNLALGLNTTQLPIIGPVAQQLGLDGVLFSDQIQRSEFGFKSSVDPVNYMILRGESEAQLSINSHWNIIGRIRAIYQPDVIDGFDAHSVDAFQGGITGGEPALYQSRNPNYFAYRVEGSHHPNPLEISGRNYLVYFPALVLDYSSGPVNVRFGNQSIAWGQSIFFRVFDVPNGLDYRRHLILDRGLEEFSDKRQPQLSLRMTYQATDEILADAFIAKFQPSVYPNPGTPYNVIPVQFTVHDRYHQFGYDDKLNYGIRLKADYGQWGWQAMAAYRYNPDGTFRWTRSGVNKPLSGALGSLVNTVYNAKLPNCGSGYTPTLCRLYDNIGEALAETPFDAAPGGVYSADEWFNYAADVRLNGLTGLNAAIDPFPASRDVFATDVDLPTEFGGTVSQTESRRQADAELNTFFIAAGGSLRGHIERVYHREKVFGLGVSYVNESDNDFLNQLIFNLEAQYTPDRNYTNTGLENRFIRQNEYTISLVVDKWHRLFADFPGTYMVFQALTKNRSDLVGRHLNGYGSEQDHVSTGLGHNANYIVFGFLQPFPNKIWAVEMASLLDPQGGILVQPVLQWNPGKGVTIEAFYNYVNGHLWGKPTNNLVSTLDFADEVTVRLAYQF